MINRHFENLNLYFDKLQNLDKTYKFLDHIWPIKIEPRR
jgi:hypothetical protein